MASAAPSYRLDRAVMARMPREVAQGWLGSGGSKEFQIDRTLTRLARDYILEHPRETAALLPAKLRYLFATDHTAFEWTRSRDFQPSALFDRAYAYSRFYYLGLWLLAAAGTATLALRGRRLWQQGAAIGLATFGSLLLGARVWSVVLCALLVILSVLRQPIGGIRVPWLAFACVATLTAFQLVYFGDARFHHAIMPWVCMSAGVWFALMFGKRTRTKELSGAQAGISDRDLTASEPSDDSMARTPREGKDAWRSLYRRSQ